MKVKEMLQFIVKENTNEVEKLLNKEEYEICYLFYFLSESKNKMMNDIFLKKIFENMKENPKENIIILSFARNISVRGVRNYFEKFEFKKGIEYYLITTNEEKDPRDACGDGEQLLLEEQNFIFDFLREKFNSVVCCPEMGLPSFLKERIKKIE